MSNKWVYTFGNGAAEGRADMRNLLGGKGANLAEMNLVGLPVPAGFTVTTEVCTYYYDNNQTYPSDLMDQVRAGIAHIENIMGKKFADMNNKKYGDKAYIKWNFTKFLVDRQGNVIARFESTVDMKDVRAAVAAELEKNNG